MKIQAILVESAFETLGVSVIVIGTKNSPPRTTALPCGGFSIFANCVQMVKFSDSVYVSDCNGYSSHSNSYVLSCSLLSYIYIL